jgi:hypothetical protein
MGRFDQKYGTVMRRMGYGRGIVAAGVVLASKYSNGTTHAPGNAWATIAWLEDATT